jgi:hypothetical protein
VNKIREYIVARPLLSAVILSVGGILLEWATKFLQSLQGSPLS